jgi:hypothetical protein
LGDWFALRTYFLTSQASPNDSRIIVIVIIVIGEAQLVFHSVGIIAQTLYLSRGFLPCEWIQPRITENATPIAKRFVIVIYQQY